ncbi:MAG: hypothetical protein JXR91_13805 [Deltaproteobacteria bacterium]|nr:hypothetical protein [Deltaproteobacteria bacterium]
MGESLSGVHKFFFGFITLILINIIIIPEDSWAQDKSIESDGGFFDINSITPVATVGEGKTFERATILKHMQGGFAIDLTTFRSPLVIEKKADDGFVTDKTLVSNPVRMHFGAHIGLFNYAQAGLIFPVILSSGMNVEKSGGAGDLHLVLKGGRRFDIKGFDFGAALTVPLVFPTGNTFYFNGEPHFTSAPSVSVDVRFKRVRAAGLAGVLLRKEIEEYAFKAGSEIKTGIGTDFYILKNSDDLVVSTELNSRFSVTGVNKDNLFMELDTSVQYRFKHNFILSGVWGMGLSGGAGTPKVRFTMELGFVPGSFFKKNVNNSNEKQTGKSRFLDSDNDDIKDNLDYCLNDPEDYDGFEDEDGCPEYDNDKDGILDIDDKCPLDSELRGDLIDNDGCPLMDRDGDLIPDFKDKCPDVKEDEDGFGDEDGCPEDDNDNDGVKDEDDLCQLLPELTKAEGDGGDDFSEGIIDGCPETFKLENGVVIPLIKVEFVPFKSEFKDNYSHFLMELAKVINFKKDWSLVTITVFYILDQHEYIAENRAIRIKNILLESGVKKEIIDTKTLQIDHQPAWNEEPNEGTVKIEIEIYNDKDLKEE